MDSDGADGVGLYSSLRHSSKAQEHHTEGVY